MHILISLETCGRLKIWPLFFTGYQSPLQCDFAAACIRKSHSPVTLPVPYELFLVIGHSESNMILVPALGLKKTLWISALSLETLPSHWVKKLRLASGRLGEGSPQLRPPGPASPQLTQQVIWQLTRDACEPRG